MNLLEHVVIEVRSAPYFKYMWCVDVIAESYGVEFPTTVHLKTEDQAKLVCAGYKFDA